MKMSKRIISVFLCLAAVSFVSCGLVQNKDGTDGTGRTTDSNGSVVIDSTGELKDAPPKEVRISFAAAGDNLIHESVYKDAAVRTAALTDGDGVEYYFKDMYSEKFRDIVGSADLAFVNQEAPMVPDRPASGYPAFNTPTEAGETLIEIGFDIVNLANNHMLDMDGLCTGLKNTMDYWNSTDIMPVGAYKDQADYNTIRIMECKGKRIAVLAYTYEFYNQGTRLNANTPNLVIPYINDSTIIDQVSRASKLADAVVVSVHWGTENTFEPTAEQRRVAALLSKYGADVVIGHHSHTLQPMEWVTNDLGERTLVIYSLGNLISSQMKAHNMVGGLATFEFVFSPEGKLTVENALLNPTMTHYSADGAKLDSQGLPTRTNVSVGMLEDYTSDMCDSHGAQLPALNGAFTLNTLTGFVTNTISDEFLTDYFK